MTLVILFSSTPSDSDLSILAWIGIPALALASIGGIGIVGSGLAIGLAAEELLLVGAGAGLVARKLTRTLAKLNFLQLLMMQTFLTLPILKSLHYVEVISDL